MRAGDIFNSRISIHECRRILILRHKVTAIDGISFLEDFFNFQKMIDGRKHK